MLVRCGCGKRECRVCREDALRMPVPEVVPVEVETPVETSYERGRSLWNPTAPKLPGKA